MNLFRDLLPQIANARAAQLGAQNELADKQRVLRFQDLLQQQKQESQGIEDALKIAQTRKIENPSATTPQKWEIEPREDGTYLVNPYSGESKKINVPGVPRPVPVRNIDPLSPQGIRARTELAAEKPATAKAGVPSSDERKMAGFHERATGAAPILDELGGQIAAASAMDQARRGTGRSAAMAPYQQQFEQAARQFVSAMLRKDTGASISKEEWKDARAVWIPDWRDSPEVLKQKAAARAQAVRELEISGGRALTVPPAPNDRPGNITLGTSSPAVSDDEFNAILNKYKK